jgi:hypothetical protein
MDGTLTAMGAVYLAQNLRCGCGWSSDGEGRTLEQDNTADFFFFFFRRGMGWAAMTFFFSFEITACPSKSFWIPDTNALFFFLR